MGISGNGDTTEFQHRDKFYAEIYLYDCVLANLEHGQVERRRGLRLPVGPRTDDVPVELVVHVLVG